MNERGRTIALIAVAAMAGAAGVFVGWRVAPPAGRSSSTEAPRPIIQIARPAPGLPSFADAIVTVCPSIAAIVGPGDPPPPNDSGAAAPAPAFAVTADGWLMTSGAAVANANAGILFSSGAEVAIGEIRLDPVSGLAIVKSSASGLTPAGWDDQSAPHVGDFALSVSSPSGAGCNAEAAMVSSDFVSEGHAPQAYLGLDLLGPDLPPGSAVLSGDGRAIGVTSAAVPVNAIIPATLVSSILDELLRNSLSPTTAFGFRSVDFSSDIAARLGNPRARGAGIAMVQPKSPAARAGLRAGDVVIAVDDSPVASASELGRALDGAGKSASLVVARGDDRLTVAIRRISGQ
ncbi:MAG TPA: PDZ domain-containing protein [Sphingomicrobium sp.]|nr:PDZ domain-containing protein [Sphingomicrobium sp.]